MIPGPWIFKHVQTDAPQRLWFSQATVSSVTF